uniref:Putative salivary secreted peptide n=1 Tax=Ixodes ricinus TaxID=34613 RepID=A0A6B0UYI1_IXORI
MDIRWTLAYFFFCVLLVLGDAQKKSEPAAPKQPKAPNMSTSSKSAAAKTKQAAPNKTPASAPTSPSTAPSTDPEICELSKKGSQIALQSLQCTLEHLPETIAGKWNAHMQAGKQKDSDLLKEICDAKEQNEDPEFMKKFSDDEKGMVNDTSILCRIRHTTPSECKVLKSVVA